VYNHRLALRVAISIVRQYLIVGSNADFGGLFFANRCNLLPAIIYIECWDGQAVHDNGEDNQKVYDRDHSGGEVVFFLSGSFAVVREEVARVLDVEDGADTFKSQTWS
jgi:hypothetical protein